MQRGKIDKLLTSWHVRWRSKGHCPTVESELVWERKCIVQGSVQGILFVHWIESRWHNPHPTDILGFVPCALDISESRWHMFVPCAPQLGDTDRYQISLAEVEETFRWLSTQQQLALPGQITPSSTATFVSQLMVMSSEQDRMPRMLGST